MPGHVPEIRAPTKMTNWSFRRFFVIAIVIVAISGLAAFGIRWEALRAMPSMQRFGWIVIVSLCAIYGILSVFLPERLRHRKIEQRPSLPFDQIYEQYFKTSEFPKEVIHDVWTQSAADLHLDEAKLRPTDRFDAELGAPLFPHAEVNASLEQTLKERFKAVSRRDWPKELKTLQEYVLLSARLQLEKAAAKSA